jgi:hypothetical protein
MQNDEPLIRPIMNLDLVIMNTFSPPAERAGTARGGIGASTDG